MTWWISWYHFEKVFISTVTNVTDTVSLIWCSEWWIDCFIDCLIDMLLLTLLTRLATWHCVIHDTMVVYQQFFGGFFWCFFGVFFGWFFFFSFYRTHNRLKETNKRMLKAMSGTTQSNLQHELIWARGKKLPLSHNGQNPFLTWVFGGWNHHVHLHQWQRLLPQL